jgi:drug/metabolite transporter (DMT)-like permease
LIIIGAEAILAFAGLFIFLNYFQNDQNLSGRMEMANIMYMIVGYMALIAGMIIFSAFHKRMYHVLFAIEMLPFFAYAILALPSMLSTEHIGSLVSFKLLGLLLYAVLILPHALYYGALIRNGKRKKSED